MTDVQKTWILLNLLCDSCEFHFEECATTTGHDENVWECLRPVMGTADEGDRTKWSATLPFSLGGLGLGSAVRIREEKLRRVWAESFEIVLNGHPQWLLSP